MPQSSRSAEIPQSSKKKNINFKAQQQAQHAATISLIVKNTGKIQKEIGFRRARLKQVYQKCGEAIQVLNQFKDVAWPPSSLTNRTVHGEEDDDDDEFDLPPSHSIDLNDSSDDALGYNNGREEKDVGAYVKESRKNMETLGGDDATAADTASDEVNVVGEGNGEQEIETGVAEAEVVANGNDKETIVESTNHDDHDEFTNLEENLTEEDVLDSNVNIGIGTVTTSEEEAEEEKNMFAHVQSATDVLQADDDGPLRSQEEEEDIDLRSVVSDVDKTEKEIMMRPEVITALNCYYLTISHPVATAKMIEIALECIGLLISNRYVIGSTTNKVSKSADDSHEELDIEEEGNNVPHVMRLINSICACADNPSDAVQSAMVKDLLSLMTSPSCSVHEAGMLKAVRTVFHIYLISKNDDVKKMSREVLLDMLRSVFQRMEAYDAVAQVDQQEGKMNESFELPKSPKNNPEEDDGKNNLFVSRFHTDSYLLFRALCKLSAKPLPEDAEDNTVTSAPGKNLRVFTGSKSGNSDPMATATKILSLELILSVFEHCGPAFRNGEKFIYAVKNFLCVSLLKNCVSSNTTVAHLSLKVFLLLVYKFKKHLKSEIEVFIANVFLPVLESPNCPFERKSLVLEALRALCADPVILTSIFLNYDCDFDAVNLYKKIVHHLTSLSVRGRSMQTPSNKSKPVSENFLLSVAGLEVLVVILQGFLKALDLPGGDDKFDEERSKVRGSLQLDVGMAAKSEDDGDMKMKPSQDDMTVTAQEIENMENATSNEDVAGKIVDAFDKKRIAQQNFELGCIKFKLSFKQGLLFFIQTGLLHMDAKEIAIFFLDHKEELDKTQIGEFFGKEPDASFVKDDGVDAEKGGNGFYIRVLHHYVDALEFTGLKFDDAIRLFLSGFRLPGESQKVDRIMEKFAEQYTLQNPDVFPSADTAFILAFAVILLQTDLHNPNIKPEKKMTQDAFVNMNKGISVDGEDLPSDFLIDLYKSVKARPFTLKEDEDARKSQSKKDENGFNDVFFATAAAERRRERFKKESAELVESTEKLFRQQKSGAALQNEFTSAIKPSDVVKPMYNITWGPLLGALSQILERAEDSSSIALCLNGFVYAVRIASHTKISLARSTFVNSLAKFTALGSIKELKPRNIESIRTLLSIAIMDGEHLSDSWMPILQCISQLGRLLFFASGVDSDDNFLHSDNNSSSKSTASAESRETEESNGRVVLEAINEILIEKVFSSSTKLSDNGILNMIDCLVHVSVSEIEGDSKKAISGVGRSVQRSEVGKGGKDVSRKRSTPAVDKPRVYSLQKLVEVADYNMKSRSRLSWAKIWELMANHFVIIGCHENPMLSMFAVDALRQLSFKFLEKAELADFNFQRLFLQPFLSIIENPNSLPDTRELILQCVDNMIRSLSNNIRSGWKIFFAILSLSANDSSEMNCRLGLSVLQHLVDCHLDDFCPVQNKDKDLKDCKNDQRSNRISMVEAKEQSMIAENFIGLCGASLAFVLSKKELPMALSMRALCHVACYADQIAEGKILPPRCNFQTTDRNVPGYTYEGLTNEEQYQMSLWRPIFDGLAGGICSTVSCTSGGVGCFIQRGSVITLRSILLRYGTLFTPGQWKAIINQSIFPAIESAAKSDSTQVMNIISESPTVSNIDFLTEPLPLPPPVDDGGLIEFAAVWKLDDSHNTSKRSMGHAELLVEASFVDLKHGGKGNLSKAFTLLNKAPIKKNIEEPFPDSWVATTAPIALGMFTDIFCLIASNYESEVAKSLWPVTVGLMQNWAVGSPFGLKASEPKSAWSPSEALVRIGCREISHLSQTVFTLFPKMNKNDVAMWLGFLCQNLAETLAHNVDLESELHADVLREIAEMENQIIKEQESDNDDVNANNRNNDYTCETQYGTGTLLGTRTDEYEGTSVQISIIKLNSGATLFGPIENKFAENEKSESLSNEENNGSANEVRQVLSFDTNSSESPKAIIMRKYISPLRVRCTSIYCLQQSFFQFLDLFALNCNQTEISSLIQAFESSRRVAEKASIDKKLSTYFEEAMRLEWGGGVEEAQAAFSSDSGVGHLGRCEMFFLTQEASANNVLIRMLSLLYCPRGDFDVDRWDTVNFSEPLLIGRMLDVLQKFIVSERENGHKLDPNVWRAASESGTKFAIHCTSFAAVVVNILYTILDFSDDQFKRQKGNLFPILCSLISIQSEEIRMLVAEILRKKVSVLIGIPFS